MSMHEIPNYQVGCYHKVLSFQRILAEIYYSADDLYSTTDISEHQKTRSSQHLHKDTNGS